ncbi:TniQ family protein [Streptomyces sp. NEAU-YJ-81]|nr:TniQ family protein [Streptomyces sp. NEAU-YJ-81]
MLPAEVDSSSATRTSARHAESTHRTPLLRPRRSVRRTLVPRTGNVISPRHLLRLTPELTAHIAGICRPSVQEVHNLTLAGQAPGFPPPHPNYLSTGRPFEAVVNEGWVCTRFSRYRPECLGDIDDTATASCWSGTWRLPMTFACLRHHRFLDWHCPAFGNPAFSTGIGTAGRWRPASPAHWRTSTPPSAAAGSTVMVKQTSTTSARSHC